MERAGPRLRQIDFVTATDPKRGNAKVTVYNLCNDVVAKVVEFDLRSESSHHKVVKWITGLRQDRMYAAAVVSADGSLVNVSDQTTRNPGDMQ